MTKLEDVLKDAVDSAHPTEAIARTDIARHIVAKRRARTGAAAAVGAGACALLATGVAQAAAPEPALPSFTPLPAASDLPAPSADPSSAPNAWWGTCGSYPLPRYPTGDTAEFSMSVTPPVVSSDHPSSIDVVATLTAVTNSEVLTAGPDFAVLYHGMVVAFVPTGGLLQLHDMALGDTQATPATLPLTRCDDGLAIPPGTYQVVTSQRYSDPSGRDSGASPRVTSPTASFTVPGDVLADPFGAADPGASTANGLPEDMLTPEIARSLLAGASDAPWDMAPGTSRWFVPSPTTVQNSTGGDLFSSPVSFGCAAPGAAGSSFPASSRDLGLLDTTLNGPSSVALAYGWVLLGPPVFDVNVVNTSGFEIPGFSGDSTLDVALVQGRRIVAEGRLAAVRTFSGSPPWVTMQAVVLDSAVAGSGLLGNGEHVGARYVWTQLDVCQGGAGYARVRPGDYLLLTSRDINLESADGSDVLDLQVWTSQGTIAVTTN